MEGNENAGYYAHATWTYQKKRHSTLQDVMYEKLSLMLIASKSMEKFHSNRRCVKDFCSQMPRTVRSSLLEKALSLVDQRTETLHEVPASVYITQVLFQKGSKELKLPYLSKTFLVEILLHLEEEGADLETLKLRLRENLFFPESVSCFPKIMFQNYTSYSNYTKRMLDTARSLVVLELPQLCNDDVLRVIGENCLRLEILDATKSPITDKGMHHLTQILKKVPGQTNGPVVDWASSLFGIPDVLMPLEKLVPFGESIECYQRRRSPLCQTLRAMKCSIGYGITDKGLLVALCLVANLCSFGCFRLDGFLSRLSKPLISKRNVLPCFGLTSVCLIKLTKDFLKFIITACPNVQKLYICKPTVPVPANFFNDFASLDELFLENFNMFQINKSSIDQSTAFRNRIKRLLFERNTQDCNLIGILNFFPSLTRLQLTLKNIIWNENGLSHPMTEHQNITNITIYGDIFAEVLLQLLKFAVNLEEIYVENILGRPHNYLKRLCAISDSPKLKIFYVYGGVFVTTKEDLMFFLSRFKNIIMVGRLPFRI